MIRHWAALVAFFYPAYWFASFLTGAAPALIRVLWFGHGLAYLRVSLRGVSAASFPPEMLGGVQPSFRHAERDPLFVSIPITLALALVLLPLARKRRAPAGLLLALVGATGLMPWLARIVFGRPAAAEAVVGTVFFGAVIAAGLRLLVTGPAGAALWKRLAWLCAVYVAPLAVLVWVLFGGMPARYRSALLIPGSVMALAVSFWPRFPQGAENNPGTAPPVKLAAAGVALSLGLFLALQMQESAQARARDLAKKQDAASIPPLPAGQPYEKLFFQRGVNFTAEFPEDYSSASARRMLETLPRYGVNAIALVPYGFTPRGETSVTFRNTGERDEDLERLSAIAHGLGIKVFLKPQIWVGRGYPGDLGFASDEERRKWLGTYREFLKHYAQLAVRVHADLFCVGVEFSRLTLHEQEWRELIKLARSLYPGPLVYAANFGPEFENIRFWDDLDYIGLNNYYPLRAGLATDSLVAKVEGVQRRFDKPVIFTEAGFSSYEAPHEKPWDETPRRIALQEQAQCYEALFRAFYHQPWFHGVYWWKIGSNGFGGPHDGSHTPWGKPAMEVVKRWFLQGTR